MEGEKIRGIMPETSSANFGSLSFWQTGEGEGLKAVNLKLAPSLIRACLKPSEIGASLRISAVFKIL